MKRFFCIIFCILILFSLTACSENDYSEETVYFSCIDTVNSFDPQLAKTTAELNIAYSCFEGLITTDKNGNIVCGCAESYSVSEDGLTYKFILKDNLYWSDGETKLTPADFEFGIKRAVMKKTASPFASALYCIKNAKKINKGSLSVEKLGVTSTESEVIITLAYKDEEFLSTLTKPVCAPCNEEFFDSTLGKYGLSSSKIISNGAFYILSYNKDDKTVGFYNNLNYSGDFSAKVKSISLNYSCDYKEIYKAFENKDIDIAPIESGYITSLDEKGYTSKLFYNTNYCFCISGLSDYTAFRKALIYGIDNSSISNNFDEYYTAPLGIIPENNVLNGENYRKSVGEIAVSVYNKKKADSLLGDFDKASEILGGLKLYYPENDKKLELIANLIVQGWQKDFNIYINSAPLSESDIKRGIKSKEFKMAIVPVKGENNLAVNSYNSLFDIGICSKLDYSTSADRLFAKEKSLIESGIIYPIIAFPDVITYADDIGSVVTGADGKIIDFRFIEK